MTMYENDEIDLKPYLQALIRKWWIFVIFVLAGAVLGLLLSRIPAEKYQSTAIILLTKQTTKLALTSQLLTVSEASDIRDRANTIITIGESDGVAAQVMAALYDQLPENTTLEKFAKSVTIKTAGDTLLVTANAKDPTLAEEIANTWSQIMVETVNWAYSGEQPPALVQAQRETAQVDYETAQASLETFLQGSQIEALQQKLGDLNIIYDGQTNDRLALYDYYRTRKNEMEAIQIQGEALKKQLQQGNRSAAADVGDALATFIARATVFNLGITFHNNTKSYSNTQQEFTVFNRAEETGLIIQFADLNTIRDSSQNYLADIEAIVELAATEQTTVETALQALSQAILSSENSTTMGDVFAQIRQVKADLENEQALYRQLTQARDLAWTAYQALAAKEVEIKNTPRASNYIVLISPGLQPNTPVARGSLRNMLIGAVAGFFISFMVIVVGVWWRSANIWSEDHTTPPAETPKEQS